MFFKHKPNLTEIRQALDRLIRESKETANRQARGSGSDNEFTFHIVRLAPEDLVPAARKIITLDVAKQTKKSFDDAELLAGPGAILQLRPEDVDFYLHLVLAVVESWLGKEESSGIQFTVSNAGAYFHNSRGQAYAEAKRWKEAEEEVRQALAFDRIQPSASLVATLVNLGQMIHAQGRVAEARDYFQEALSIFQRLSPQAICYEQAQAAVEKVNRHRSAFLGG